jgi:hypothetical protein
VRAQHVTGEPSTTGARFDDHERIRVVELVPAPVERARDAGPEERADLGAGDEVATGPARATAGGEEADLGFVQGDLDEAIERDRALAPYDAPDRGGGASG